MGKPQTQGDPWPELLFLTEQAYAASCLPLGATRGTSTVPSMATLCLPLVRLPALMESPRSTAPPERAALSPTALGSGVASATMGSDTSRVATRRTPATSTLSI